MTTPEPIFIAGFETVLIREAARAAEDARAAGDPVTQAGKVLSSILLSVAAVEAAMGIWTVLFGREHGVNEATLRTWRRSGAPQVMKDLLLRLRQPVNVRDVAWYNAFCAIVALRNHVAHYFPEYRTPGTWPEELKGYITAKLLVPGGDTSMDWTSRLLTSSLAEQVVAHGKAIFKGFATTAWPAA